MCVCLCECVLFLLCPILDTRETVLNAPSTLSTPFIWLGLCSRFGSGQRQRQRLSAFYARALEHAPGVRRVSASTAAAAAAAAAASTDSDNIVINVTQLAPAERRCQRQIERQLALEQRSPEQPRAAQRVNSQHTLGP